MLVVGIGGAGCYMAKHVHTKVGGRLAVVNTDPIVLEESITADRLLIGDQQQKNGDNTLVRGKRAAEESRDALTKLLENVDQLILLAGFGGATGTGAAPVIAQIAQSKKIPVCLALTIPFAFESVRREVALVGVSELKKAGVPIFVYDHEETMRSENCWGLSMTEALELACKALARCISQHLKMKD